LVEAILAAADQFPHPGQDEADRIHDVRRTLKRAAGLSRLFTPLVGAPAYQALKALNAARRSVGRARDLDILPGVLARLQAPTETRDLLLRVIAEQREAERLAHREIDVGGLSAELRTLARSVEGWDVETAGAEPLLLAVRRTYREARRLGHRARASGELQRLRKTLGDHNDLAILAEFARGRPELPHAEAEGLIALVAHRSRPLERRANEQFSRLFVERPGAFEQRIAAYLERPQRKPGAPARRPPGKSQG
jgi:CHAD domain-containing protein